MERKNYRRSNDGKRKASGGSGGSGRRDRYRSSSALKPGMEFYIIWIIQENKAVDIPNDMHGFIRIIPSVATALLVPDLKLVQLYVKSSSELMPEDTVTYSKSGDIIQLKGYIKGDKLNDNELMKLEAVIVKYIKANPEPFLNAINHAPPLSLTKHSLELLPNVGKKTMQNMVKEISIKKFESLDDLRKRGTISAEAIAQRVIEEMTLEDEKNFMFVKWRVKRDDADSSHRSSQGQSRGQNQRPRSGRDSKPAGQKASKASRGQRDSRSQKQTQRAAKKTTSKNVSGLNRDR